MAFDKRTQRQADRERVELAAYVKLPNASPVGYAWCGEHDCRPGTCFPLHHPTAFRYKRGKVTYK